MIKKLLLNHSPENVIVERIHHELQLANTLIQEGRISHECDSAEGQALENGIKTSISGINATHAATLLQTADCRQPFIAVKAINWCYQ
jgi:hypothetical protein